LTHRNLDAPASVHPVRKKGGFMNHEQVIDLLLQSLEHERGGIKVYETALEMRAERRSARGIREIPGGNAQPRAGSARSCEALEIDPETESPGREIVRTVGGALVEAMKKAKASGKPDAAEIVACECVVLAETKDHLNWELIGQLADAGEGDGVEALQDAYDEVEDQEDEHLYHSKGWCRELWLQALGLRAQLPPPEERKHVKTAIGAARAEQSRKGKG
jgi:hypothetical protein